MDFKDTPEEAKFRKQCREWLEKNATPKDESTPQNDDFANVDKMKAAKNHLFPEETTIWRLQLLRVDISITRHVRFDLEILFSLVSISISKT